MADLTKEERAAIAALKRLEKRWPRALILVHIGVRGRDRSAKKRHP